MSSLARFCQQYFRELSLFYFIFGACVGSFLNVCIWRIPQGQSIIFPGSHCPSCKSKIPLFENIPIVSWLLLRGKCSQCQVPISPRYLLVELTTAWIFFLLWYRIFINIWPLALLVPFSFIIAASITVGFIDYEYFVIPNKIIVTGLIFATIWGIAFPITHQYDHLNRLFFEKHLNTLLFSFKGTFELRQWLNWPLAIVALDMGFGIIYGGGLLFIFRNVGKIIWGKKRTMTKEAVELTITGTGMQIGQEKMNNWGTILSGNNDFIKIYGRMINSELDSQNKRGHNILENGEENEEILIRKGEIRLQNNSFQLDKANLSIRSRHWIIYQEVMGMGDVKLMAMLGAFLGPIGALVIIFISSTMATLFGMVQGLLFGIIFSRPWPRKIPLGPFIAIAAIGYIFIGKELVSYLLPI